MRRGALSQWNLVLERLSERLGKSFRVFVIGLFVACGIEVAVDWNATLYEINVLRASLRQKSEDYVDIIRRAAEPAVAAYDWDALDGLSQGLLDDEDVVYVRFSDALGNTLHDRLRGELAGTFRRRHPEGFREYYRHQMERDAGGMLADPLALRDRIAQSRHRDLIQGFTDAELRLLARFSAPPPPHEPPPQVLYQDRLYDDARQLDRSLSYALGVITTERGEPTGVVLVALRHDRMNRAVAGKLLKGFAVTVFFVCLILVQNVLARKAKLRLLELESALFAARSAIAAATPEVPAYVAGELGVAFAQASRLGGTVYDLSSRADGSVDLMLAVPAGAGVDAAFASVVLRDHYRRQPADVDPATRATALLAAYDGSPLAREVELLCAHFGPDGVVRGVVSGLRPPSWLGGDGQVHAVPLGDPLSPAARLRSPLRPFVFALADGAFALFDDGLPAGATRRLLPGEALTHMADRWSRTPRPLGPIAEAAIVEAVKRYRKRHTDDFFVLLAARLTARLLQLSAARV